MKKLSLLIFALFTFSAPLFAQQQETIFGRHGFHFSGIWGAFTNHYSFFEDARGYHTGGNIGLEFGRTVFLGYAWSKLKDQIQVSGANTSFQLRQNNFLLSITPNARQVVHPMLSFQTGGGRVTLSDGESDRVYIFQPSAGIEINVFSWFHLGLQGGYRFFTEVDLPQIDRQDLSSPFAQVDLRFGISWGRF